MSRESHMEQNSRDMVLANMKRFKVELPEGLLGLATKTRTPKNIYRFLMTKKYEKEDVTRNPPEAIKAKKLHCFDGAFLGFTLGLLNGMDMRLIYLEGVADNDHMIVVFKENGKYGAFSQSGNPELVWREANFDSVDDIVLSFKKGYPHRGAPRFSDVVGYSQEMDEDFFVEKGIGFGWMVSMKEYKHLFHVVTNKLKYRLFKDVANGKLDNWLDHPLLIALQNEWIRMSGSGKFKLDDTKLPPEANVLYLRFFRLKNNLRPKDDDTEVRSIMWRFFKLTGTTPDDLNNMTAYLNDCFLADGFQIEQLVN